MSFTERFNCLRKASGKTQAKVAEELGMRPQSISYIAKGREPTLDTVVTIARYFGVTTDFLLGASEHEAVSFSSYEDIVRILLTLIESSTMSCEMIGVESFERAAFIVNRHEVTMFFSEYGNMVTLFSEGKITKKILRSWMSAEFQKLRDIPLPRLLTWEEFSREFDVDDDTKNILDGPIIVRRKAGDVDGEH